MEKIYPNGFKAIHDLTFGVEEGQIFCLLGPNGVGKTTAFEILTSQLPKTRGEIKFRQKILSRENFDIFYQTGVCAQSNTLWDSLTVKQHLRVYARIKGVKNEEIDPMIEYLLTSLQLTEYAHRSANKLSGGNKRKLCVAICMIGTPSLMFLDEPSTGMDPVARKNLWNLIKEVMKTRKAAMVLTTHYMQEAELIGDKLGMINSLFFSVQYLFEALYEVYKKIFHKKSFIIL